MSDHDVPANKTNGVLFNLSIATKNMFALSISLKMSINRVSVNLDSQTVFRQQTKSLSKIKIILM